uniref:Uncharacterized protein n=1 Tax=Zea mays TaxID=4577 RepID=A0A804MSE9_MAIZE
MVKKHTGVEVWHLDAHNVAASVAEAEKSIDRGNGEKRSRTFHIRRARADGQTQLSHEIALELSQRSAAAGLRPIGAVVFMQRGVLKVCLRTTDSTVNTSEIAKAYGGGGKRSSSSFTLRMDEFNIWTSQKGSSSIIWKSDVREGLAIGLGMGTVMLLLFCGYSLSSLVLFSQIDHGVVNLINEEDSRITVYHCGSRKLPESSWGIVCHPPSSSCQSYCTDISSRYKPTKADYKLKMLCKKEGSV